MDDVSTSADTVRLDIWLDVACLFKTRSEAQKACKGGKIRIRRQPAKPNRALRVGDELEIERADGRTERVVVRALADRHVTRALARKLYADLTPAPTPDELAQRRAERLYRAMISRRAPDKRQRRQLRRLKGLE